MKRISAPIESLMIDAVAGRPLLETDYLIVGSGYGGAVAAMRLAHDGPGVPPEQRRRVVVLERGREYGLGDFPYDFEDIPSHVRMAARASEDHPSPVRRAGPLEESGGYTDALFHFYAGSEAVRPDQGKKDMRGRSVADVLVGSGLGGTSLINANVAEEPSDRVFAKHGWPAQILNQKGALAPAFQAVRDHLGVTQRSGPAGQQFPKYAALKKFADKITDVEEPVRAAWITVNTSEDGNALGVKQAPCTDCGNCVTGCNVGAKNSLDRNLLRLAKSRGAEFFTGATVSRIVPNAAGGEYAWKIEVQCTVQTAGTVDKETYAIHAKNVILAAGSLGSTEILLNSSKSGELQLSPRLGEKFSTNGDGLIMSYAQTTRVGAIAEAAQKQPLKAVGPTITGIVRAKGVSIEEASVPASLARIFSELVTTSAMLQRMVERKLPRLVDNDHHDPLAASMAVADHCQAFLVQGDDGANGELSLCAVTGALKIAFPHSNIVDNTGLVTANDLVKKQDRKTGLDGGQYAPNPLWRLVPKEASGVLGGKLPTGRALTVHPLGGCAMADDVAGGVVNHAGQVFKPDGSLYAGLYVMDGAIIPVALEVNPFLTIAALAWRCCDTMLTTGQESRIERVSADYTGLGPVPDRERNRPLPTEFVIQEQLTGELKDLPRWFKTHLSDADQKRLSQNHGLVVTVTAGNDQAEAWLDNPGNQPLDATMRLYVNPMPSDMVGQYRPVGVTGAHMKSLPPFLELPGKFSILPETLPAFPRLAGIRAVSTYVKRRGRKDVNLTNPDDSIIDKIRNGLRGAGVFFNLGVLQSRVRRLSYDFIDSASGIRIHGDKVLGYSEEPRLWPALLNLELTIDDRKARDSSSTRLTVNIEHLLEPGLLQIQKSANLPQSLLFAGGVAAFFMRSVFATNFWELAALEYPDTTPHRPRPPVLKTRTHTVDPVHYPLTVPLRLPGQDDSGKSIELKLTRYPQPDRKPVLLIHGLAQGSQIFWTGGERSLAAYCYEKGEFEGFENGYDVWLLDYRLSNLVLPGLFDDPDLAEKADQDWSMDEIAQLDIPEAINRIYAETGQKVLVIAHCVGACTLAMAALSQDKLHEKIEAAVCNAIHPWVIASPANRFRNKFGNFFREYVPGGLLDAIPTKENAGAMQNVIDRLAYGLAKLNEQPEDEHRSFDDEDTIAQGICDRMTFLYGRMWNHKNLSRETHSEFAQMLGPAPSGVYQHLYYYNQLQRVTDRDGENHYLQHGLIQSRWTFPVLFVHGEDSRVFNPHSARRSALRLRNNLWTINENLVSKIHYRLYEGYGHMDVIFGKDAHNKCYPEYSAFFRAPQQFRSQPDYADWGDPQPTMPIVGPVLRAAWTENAKIGLRIWSELRTNVTRLPTRLIADGTNQHSDFEIQVPNNAPVSSPRFRMLDVEIANFLAPIELSVRGDMGNTGGQFGAMLKYDTHAWLRRLRSKDGNGYQKHMRFLVGSCRFPGSVVDNALSDQVFVKMEEHATASDGAELLFLIGDQIYADKIDQLFESNSLHARYSDRYRRAFKKDYSPYFARLVTQIPTHFAPDDHEIDDNWSGLPPSATKARLESEFAIDTAARFMSSGRNSHPILNNPASGHFWYALSHPNECDFPAFVADTRTERAFRASNNACPPTLDPNRDRDLMLPQQYRALKTWLRAAQVCDPDAPKFIFSGSIIAPLSKRYCEHKSTWRQQDGWAGYPKTLEDLLTFIAQEAISKVVFVGGDAHLSSTSEMKIKLASGEEAVVWQIVSSGLYAPLPFANSHVEDFDWFDPVTLPIHSETNTGQPVLTVISKNTPLSDHYHQFMRVDASENQIEVTCMNEFNQEVARKRIPL